MYLTQMGTTLTMNQFEKGKAWQAPKPTADKASIGADRYKTLMDALVLDNERPTTDLGTFVANSTKRSIRETIQRLLQP